MRLLGALLVTVTILGGLKAFFAYRDHHRPAVAGPKEAVRAVDDYTMSITLTFDAAPDEFALDPDNSASLLVEHRGELVYMHRAPIPAGTSLQIPLAGQLVVGKNELFVRASASVDSPAIDRAIRVRVMRGQARVLADQSIWSEPGAPVEGTVRLLIGKGAIDRGANRVGSEP